MSADSIADRLRQLKDQNGWTAAQMAEMTGISKRTIESYMRRENAPLPGVEALQQIARGLRISLDWLLLGDADATLGGVLLVRLTAERAALPTLRNIIETQRRNEQVPEPEFLAQEIGGHAAEMAEMLITSGLTMMQIAAFIKISNDAAENAMKAKLVELNNQLNEQRNQLDALRAKGDTASS
ncbi:helix-turn-helix transcriptional regulator [Rhodobacter capsulatus]|uniref:Transcriptional regulator, contains XRE-family HTH domain n=1 Tax=Rhodobacter capsulatus TaxID=1061 RepID=A0A1G7K8E3_RHOCA|nr:helix-turn-helix transcriptional regulator [Rhodobacter capsulatus]WER07885.1 helix-turn-helix transcriptional regulator [Rhodobacter capsulatus]SDF33291.1 Transcriptional regulator, contains XRE-family HTH domain [Rhodobacter capsulatus]